MELTTERDEANELVDQMREHLDDYDRLIEQWIEVFEMQQDEHGKWPFDPSQSELWERVRHALEREPADGSPVEQVCSPSVCVLQAVPL